MDTRHLFGMDMRVDMGTLSRPLLKFYKDPMPMAYQNIVRSSYRLSTSHPTLYFLLHVGLEPVLKMPHRRLSTLLRGEQEAFAQVPTNPQEKEIQPMVQKEPSPPKQGSFWASGSAFFIPEGLPGPVPVPRLGGLVWELRKIRGT